jgi:hypothetical protein
MSGELLSGVPVYFTDARGMRYRVLDAIMRDGDMIVADPPTAGAMFRVFRPETGQQRVYWLRPGENRAPEAPLLERQLRGADFLRTASQRADEVEPP